MRKKQIRIIVLSIFSLLIVSLSVGYSLLKEKIIINGKATIIIEETNNQYIVSYTIDQKWFSNNKYYYKITINILNNTDKTLEGWRVSISKPENGIIENYYNTNCYINNDKIQFENLVYNSQIFAKKTVSFGFQISTTQDNYKPENITINDETEKPPEEDKPEENNKMIEITMNKENSWKSNGNYFLQYNIIIKNTGKSNINSWQFDIESPGKFSIDQIWNAIYEENTNSITLKNSTYNGFIDANNSISFGVIVKAKKEQIEFNTTNIILK